MKNNKNIIVIIAILIIAFIALGFWSRGSKELVPAPLDMSADTTADIQADIQNLDINELDQEFKDLDREINTL